MTIPLDVVGVLLGGELPAVVEELEIAVVGRW